LAWEHGHNSAIAYVLDGRFERGPAAPISLVAERANPTQETVAAAIVGRAGEKRARQAGAEPPTVVPALEGHVNVVGVFRVDEPVLGADGQVTRHIRHILYFETFVLDLPRLSVVGVESSLGLKGLLFVGLDAEMAQQQKGSSWPAKSNRTASVPLRMS
jgi:hypothetical protein